MAEEFQTGICGEAWWINPPRSSSLSPCSAARIGLSDHIGSFLWSTTTKSCEESNNSVSADSSSRVFQSIAHKHQQTDSDNGGSSTILMDDSTLQMMNLSSSSTNWNQPLFLDNGKAENNHRTMMLDNLNSQIQKEWSPKSAGDQDNCTDLLSAGFPVNSTSYGYNSALLQSYFEPDHPQLTVQQSVYNNLSMASNYMSTENYETNISNHLSPSWPKFAAKRLPGGLHYFSNNTPFWNPSAAAGLNDNRPGLPATALGEKRNCPTFTSAKYNDEEVHDSGSAAKKGSSEPIFKRPRIETPSPLPTFKVRKEKLGDRITALQQLVSPFGKTDTASVLHEAIEYIKFLHDQVSVLTTPYMKKGIPIPQQQSSDHKLKDPEAPKQDLKSRGLCLVPISSTFPVANETTADLWIPTFGGTFSLEEKRYTEKGEKKEMTLQRWISNTGPATRRMMEASK